MYKQSFSHFYSHKDVGQMWGVLPGKQWDVSSPCSKECLGIYCLNSNYMPSFTIKTAMQIYAQVVPLTSNGAYLLHLGSLKVWLGWFANTHMQLLPATSNKNPNTYSRIEFAIFTAAEHWTGVFIQLFTTIPIFFSCLVAAKFKPPLMCIWKENF